MSWRACLWAMAISCCGMSSWSVALAADSNPSSPGAQKPKKPPKSAVAKARDKLAAAKRDLLAARARVGEAQVKIKRAQQQAADMRAAAQARRDSDPALQAARGALEQSRKELESAKAPLLEKLHQQPKYLEAVAEREALQRKIEAAPGGLPKGKLEEWEHQLALATARVSQLDREALEANELTKDRLMALSSDERDVHQQLRKLDAELATDPGLKLAMSQLDQAKTELLNAEKDVADKAHKLAVAEENLAKKTPAKRKRGAKNRR